MTAEAKTFRTTDGDEFTMLFSIRGIMAAEDAGGAGFGELIQGAAQGRLGYLAGLIYGGLKVHHPGLTLEETWALMDGPDGAELGKALWPAIESAMPNRKAGPENPPVPRGGTGTRSSARGSKKDLARKISTPKPRAVTQ